MSRAGVRRGEQITLGHNTPMPWPNLCSITVGRLPDNDVVVPLDVVSGRHARLEREGNRVLLIDLDSRNGTSLNDPRNKISRAAIQPGDVVFLGTHKIMAAQLLAALPEGRAGSRAGAARHENRGAAARRSRREAFTCGARQSGSADTRVLVPVLSVGSLLGAGDGIQRGLCPGSRRGLLDISGRPETASLLGREDTNRPDTGAPS